MHQGESKAMCAGGKTEQEGWIKDRQREKRGKDKGKEVLRG